jgi:peptidase C25-like protein
MRPLPPSQPESDAWVVAGPKSALARLSPLIDAHSSCRSVRVVEINTLSAQQLHSELRLQPQTQLQQMPQSQILQDQIPRLPINDAASLLIIGDPRRSPRTALPGIFVRAANGRRIPTGWLPDVGDRLSDYARAAAEVQLRTNSEVRPHRNEVQIRRINEARLHQIVKPQPRPIREPQFPAIDTATPGPFVLLGEFSPRALQWAEWFSAELPKQSAIFQWTAERITRPNLITGLRFGAGAAFYFGHGTPNGWFGYGGFDKSDALASRGRPIGCIISFSCSVARRPAHSLSFCEDLVLSGLCAAAIGSTRPSLHHRNVEWSLAFAQILRRRRATTLCDLLSDPALPLPALNSYRILGDPMAQLIGHPECASHSKKIFAPAPTDALPIIPLSQPLEFQPIDQQL